MFLFRFVLSFISCCSIFKDHRLLAACSCDLFIISHFLAFVKGFCKSFLSFFLKLFCLPFLDFVWLRPLYYITFSSVCQVVSRKFFKSFSKPLGSLPLLTRPVYYIILHRVCQEVLQKFFESFCRLCACLLSRSSLVDSSYIIAHPVRNVKHFFRFFADLCRMCTIHSQYLRFVYNSYTIR